MPIREIASGGLTLWAEDLAPGDAPPLLLRDHALRPGPPELCVFFDPDLWRSTHWERVERPMPGV